MSGEGLLSGSVADSSGPSSEPNNNSRPGSAVNSGPSTPVKSAGVITGVGGISFEVSFGARFWNHEEDELEDEETDMENHKLQSQAPQNIVTLSDVRRQLFAKPDTLIGRSKQREKLSEFIKNKLIMKTSGSMYISGQCGIGKTATVMAVVNDFVKQAEEEILPRFKLLEINAMKLLNPQKVFQILWKGFSGEKVSPDKAKKLLGNVFVAKTQRGKKKSGPKVQFKKQAAQFIVIIDEIDQLMNKKQDIVYDLYNWASMNDGVIKMILLTISNALSMMPKVRSRLTYGGEMIFEVYTKAELEEIILIRLKKIEAFDRDAISYCASKIAKSSGDARKAIQICIRAVDIAELTDTRVDKSAPVLATHGRVNTTHFKKAMKELLSSDMDSTSLHRMKAIQRLPLHEKIFMVAVNEEMRLKNKHSALFVNVCHTHYTLSRRNNIDENSLPNESDLALICSRLVASGLLKADHARNDLYTEIRLLLPETSLPQLEPPPSSDDTINLDKD